MLTLFSLGWPLSSSPEGGARSLLGRREALLGLASLSLSVLPQPAYAQRSKREHGTHSIVRHATTNAHTHTIERSAVSRLLCADAVVPRSSAEATAAAAAYKLSDPKFAVGEEPDAFKEAGDCGGHRLPAHDHKAESRI